MKRSITGQKRSRSYLVMLLLACLLITSIPVIPVHAGFNPTKTQITSSTDDQINQMINAISTTQTNYGDGPAWISYLIRESRFRPSTMGEVLSRIRTAIPVITIRSLTGYIRAVLAEQRDAWHTVTG